MRTPLAALLLALSAAVSGCESAAPAIKAATSNAQSLFGDWALAQLGGKDVASLVPEGGKTPNLAIANDGRISGSTGVNNIMSSLDLGKLAKGDFSLTPVASTMMAGSPEAMSLESSFLKALGEVKNFNLDGNALNLTNGKETLLKFLRAGS
jgi:heat shock protein HslJ